MKFKSKLLLFVMALVLVVSLVACGDEKTPDVTEAPAITTTEAPATTTDAPAVTTEAPAVTTEAPAVTTEAPAVTTEAPVVTTAAPVVTTEAPVVTTAAPVVTTTKAPVTTQAPVVTTASSKPLVGFGPANKAFVVRYTAETANGSIEVIEGETFTLPVEAKEDYNFLGYFTADDVQVTDENGQQLADYVLDANIKVVAKYEIMKHTISYTANGESGSEVVDRKAGFTLPVIEKENAIFLGYVLEDGTFVTDEIGNVLPDYVLISDITVSAKYRMKANYKLSYENVEIVVEAYENFAIEPATKVDYRFLGWKIAGEEGVMVTDKEGNRLENFVFADYDPDGTYDLDNPIVVAIEPEFEPIEYYYIDYSGNGQSGVVNVIVGELQEGKLVEIPVIDKEDHNFLGYFLEDGTQVTDEDGKQLSTYKLESDITVVAKYEIMKHTITYNENGDSKTFARNEVFELPVVTKDNAKFLGYILADSAEVTYVTDANGKQLEKFKLTEDITVTADYENIMSYKELYVGYNNGTFENTSLVVDFYAAKATDGGLTPKNEATYTDATKSSGVRFEVGSVDYVDYTVYAASGVSLSGGTAPILSGWYFQNYYKEGYWAWEENGTATGGDGKVANMRTSDNGYTSGDGTATVSSKTVYYKNTTVEGVTDYYMQNGTWAKPTYASKWQDGYLELGKNSAVSLVSAINAAAGDDNDYTVQFVMKSIDGSSLNPMIGVRFTIENKSGKIRISGGNKDYTSSLTEHDFDATFTDINTYTFGIARSAAADNFVAYINGEKNVQTLTYIKNDGTYKIFEGGNPGVYAIRVYNYVLSDAEVAQNHFADLVGFFGLEVTDKKFGQLGKAEKAQVYELAKAYSFASSPEEIAKLQGDIDNLIQDLNAGKVSITYGDGLAISVDKDATEYEIPFAEQKGFKFKGYYTEPNGQGTQVTDEKGVSVGYKIEKSITVYPFYEEIPYNSLYVGYNKDDNSFENASLIVDFLWATSASEVVKNVNYYDETKYASERFGADASTYTPFTVFSTKYIDTTDKNREKSTAVTGGTAPISAPWKFKNYSGSNHWIFDGGKNTGGASKAADENGVDFNFIESYYKQDEARYYVTNAKTYAKMNYESSFGNGYFHMGANSFLTFTNAVSAAKLSGDGSYTVQFVAKRIGSGTWGTYLGQRFNISQAAEGQISIGKNGAQYSAFDTVKTDKALGYDIDNVNTYTFSFDRSSLPAAVIGINVNTTEIAALNLTESTNEGMVKIFETADANIYAIRVYNYVLSADEIAQNNFADIAKFNSLDIDGFLTADANAKAAVYAEFAGKTLDNITATEAQALLDSTLAE